MKKILFVLLTGILLYSCKEDFLDVKPTGSISTDIALSRIEDLKNATNGLYSSFKSSGYYGRYFVIFPDVMGNICKDAAELNRGADPYLHLMTNTTIGLQDLYALPSYVIARSTKIINANPSYGDTTKVGIATLNNYMGQVYACRALAYFDQVRLFGQPYGMDAGASLGVPIITDPTLDILPTRATVAEVYAQIISDLDSAVSKLTSSHIDNNLITMWGAKALLARVYLYKQDWANAAYWAGQVIDGTGPGKPVLVPAANAAAMGNIFLDASTETIFQISMTASDNRGSDAIWGMYQNYNYFAVSDEQYALYTANDKRRAGFFKLVSSHQRPNKQINSQANTIILRLAEMRLIRAEANARAALASGGDAVRESAARADIQVISNRALTVPVTIPATLTGQALIDRVMLERKMELCFEGNDIWDINRTGQNMTRLNKTASAQAYGTTMVCPIPKNELDTNPNMVQNPGY
ncbi:MAG: RagB/SusD family nutrient uptake outer membrane protein [Bacteroidales bacterium]|nr:MAG: RagB/SusD family nutrient uptake outer membrane protein [Bacteroidales bacterium]